MLIGHYALALAVKRIVRRAPLWMLFVVVQIVDLVWAALFVFGVRQPHVAGSGGETPLGYVPHNSGLIETVVLSLAFAVIAARWIERPRRRPVVWIAVAGLSAWVLDFLLRFPSLPLVGMAPYLRPGLPGHPWFELGLEIALVVLAMAYYMGGSRPCARTGRGAPWTTVVVMAAVACAGRFLPVSDPRVGATIAIGCYALFAALGLWLDRTRVAKASPDLGASNSNASPAMGPVASVTPGEPDRHAHAHPR